MPVEICPGDTPQFNCTVNDTVNGYGSTFWVLTVNGTEYSGCGQTHPELKVKMCVHDAFLSYLSDKDETYLHHL